MAVYVLYRCLCREKNIDENTKNKTKMFNSSHTVHKIRMGLSIAFSSVCSIRCNARVRRSVRPLVTLSLVLSSIDM